MLELLLALGVGPLPQTAPTEAPRSARSGDLTVSQGGVTTWPFDSKPGGQVSVVVDNAGASTDRVTSMRTPTGPVGRIVAYPVVGPRSGPAPDGDLTIRPGRTALMADLASLSPADPAEIETTVTVVFERAGEITVQAVPNFPVAAPPPPARP